METITELAVPLTPKLKDPYLTYQEQATIYEHMLEKLGYELSIEEHRTTDGKHTLRYQAVNEKCPFEYVHVTFTLKDEPIDERKN